MGHALNRKRERRVTQRQPVTPRRIARPGRVMRAAQVDYRGLHAFVYEVRR